MGYQVGDKVMFSDHAWNAMDGYRIEARNYMNDVGRHGFTKIREVLGDDVYYLEGNHYKWYTSELKQYRAPFKQKFFKPIVMCQEGYITKIDGTLKLVRYNGDIEDIPENMKEDLQEYIVIQKKSSFDEDLFKF